MNREPNRGNEWVDAHTGRQTKQGRSIAVPKSAGGFSPSWHRPSVPLLPGPPACEHAADRSDAADMLDAASSRSDDSPHETSGMPDTQQPADIHERLTAALAAATNRSPRVLHVIRERDVGLFSLIQQVMANIPWALHERRLPVVDFRDRVAYWTPDGHRGANSVWEYYFEPVVPGLPQSAVPETVIAAIEQAYPDQTHLGFFATKEAFVSNHFGDHPSLAGIAPAVPYTTGNPDGELRHWTSAILQRFVRPRAYVTAKADAFFDEYLAGRDLIGVHARGTDAVSTRETRAYRQGSLDFGRFEQEIDVLLTQSLDAKVFVATDAQASLERLRSTFGERVIAYDAVRHVDGEAAGSGPTGCIMPAYIAADPATAAQNGEDAVVEYLLLGRCAHLVHNGASLATTVLLRDPRIADTNTHHHA